jgi:hypothetical protein
VSGVESSEDEFADFNFVPMCVDDDEGSDHDDGDVEDEDNVQCEGVMVSDEIGADVNGIECEGVIGVDEKVLM